MNSDNSLQNMTHNRLGKMKIMFALCATILCSCVVENSLRMREDADAATNGMVFIKHQRSSLCFAYIWQGGNQGGPAIATVPCEKVEHLLYLKPEKECQGGK